MIWGVPSHSYDVVRERVRDSLQSVVDRSCGDWSMDSLEAAIRSADRQLWIVGEFQAVVITSVAESAVHIEAVTGTDRKAWSESGIAHFEAWARSLGKKYLKTLARPGWTPTLKGAGFKEIHREFAKAV